MNEWERTIEYLATVTEPDIMRLEIAQRDEEHISEAITKQVERVAGNASFLKLAELVDLMDMAETPTGYVDCDNATTAREHLETIVIHELEEVLWGRFSTYMEQPV